MAGYLEDSDLFHGGFFNPPPQWDSSIGDLGGYFFVDRASGGGTTEEFMSLQTLTGSQTFTLSASTDTDYAIIFKIQEISYPGGPAVGAAFDVLSTIYERTLLNSETTGSITVELPSEMHIRVTARSDDQTSSGDDLSDIMRLPNELTLTLQEGSGFELFWTRRTNTTERPL